MNKSMKYAFATALAVVVLSPCLAVKCFAADSPWNGTWKLNEAKSKMTGETVTITDAGSGMYSITNGPVSFKFACDGKDYAVLANRTQSCTGSGNEYTRIFKIDGKVISTTKQVISADGKTMEETTTGVRPDGSSFTSHDTDVREGSGTGIVGTWKEVKTKTNVATSIKLTLHDGMLHYEDVEYKDVSDTKLDGTPGAVTGGNAPAGLMVATKGVGADKVESVVTLNGKELNKDVMTISADGKMITDVSWAPGKESEKRTYVYDKQ